MKQVIGKNSCEVCGEMFDAEYIQHENQKEDFEWEKQEEYPLEYPHLHEQPTQKCNLCPSCRVVKQE